MTYGDEPGRPVRVLALGGSPRRMSLSGQALELAADAAEVAGAQVHRLIGRDLLLPIYDPGEPARTVEARRLLAEVRAADALLIAAPGYHGTISGMVKNALDYLEDLRRDPFPYLEGKAVGCVAVAHGWQAAVGTLHALRTVVHALRGWPSPLGVAVDTSGLSLGADGRPVDVDLIDRFGTIAEQVVDFAASGRGLPAALLRTRTPQGSTPAV